MEVCACEHKQYANAHNKKILMRFKDKGDLQVCTFKEAVGRIGIGKPANFFFIIIRVNHNS